MWAGVCVNEEWSGASTATINDFYPLDKLPDAQKHYRPGKGHLSDEHHNWFFGMRYTFDFTVGDYTGPLTYTFSGDDDLWVFLDGRLILDLGGEHSAFPDLYNETSKKYKPWEAVWRNDVNLWWFLNDQRRTIQGYDADLAENKKEKRSDHIDPNESHQITVLYMERGGIDSNCSMKFVIPGLKPVNVEPIQGDKRISVEKKWGQNNDDKDNPYVVLQIKTVANPQIVLASRRADEDFAPHYQGTVLPITGTKIPLCKLIAQRYFVLSDQNGSSSSPVW